MCRVRNLLAKFCEFSVYKVIASHPHKPKIRNISPKFSKLAKGGAELIDIIPPHMSSAGREGTYPRSEGTFADLTPIGDFMRRGGGGGGSPLKFGSCVRCRQTA